MGRLAMADTLCLTVVDQTTCNFSLRTPRGQEFERAADRNDSSKSRPFHVLKTLVLPDKMITTLDLAPLRSIVSLNLAWNHLSSAALAGAAFSGARWSACVRTLRLSCVLKTSLSLSRSVPAYQTHTRNSATRTCTQSHNLCGRDVQLAFTLNTHHLTLSTQHHTLNTQH